MSSEAGFSQLVGSAQAGDGAALERLMLMYRPTVISETRKFAGSLKSDVSVQDLEQETWIRVWTRLPGFVGSEDDETCRKIFASWLSTTTRRVAVGIVEAGRAKKRGGDEQPETLDHVPISDERKSPSSMLQADEERTLVTDAMNEIDSVEAAEVLRLHYFEGLPIAQVAEQMALTSDQVRYRLRLALESLGRKLED